MNLSVSYSEIESFVRNNYNIDISISSSEDNRIFISIPFSIAGNTITVPLSFSVKDVTRSTLILQLESTMNGVNDLLKGALTVLHDNIFSFIVPLSENVFEVNLGGIPQLSSAVNMFSINSLDLEASEVAVDVSLK